jgi:VWFA-related protein
VSLRKPAALLGVAIFLANAWATPAGNPELHAATQPLNTGAPVARLTVTVTDKAGKPAHGLVAQDFRILRNGVELRLAGARELGAAQTCSGPAENQPALGAFSNVPKINQRRAYRAVLLDERDTLPDLWEQSWPELLKTLKALLPQHDFAVYTLTLGGLGLAKDFDENPAPLLRRLEKVRTTSLADLLPKQPLLVRSPATFAERRDEVQTPEFVSSGQPASIVDVLGVAAAHFAGLCGAKSLVWFSGVFPEMNRHLKAGNGERARLRLLRALNALIAANVQLYPVAIRSQKEHGGVGVLGTDTVLAFTGNDGVFLSVPADDCAAPEFLAHESGGRTYFNANGIAEAIREPASRPEDGTYVLDFDDDRLADNRFHPVQVVTKPDLQVKGRTGYWALSKETPLDIQSDLLAALESPFEQSGLELQADIEPGAGRLWSLNFYLNPQNLTLLTGREGTRAEVTVLFGQKDERGRTFATQPVQTQLSVAQATLVSRAWLKIHTTVSVRPQSQTLRIVVREDGSGRMGTLDIPNRQRS